MRGMLTVRRRRLVRRGWRRLEGDDFFPGLVELVVIPLVVNLASSAAYDLLKKLVARLRRGRTMSRGWSVADGPAGSGDVMIVVRGGGGLP